MTEQKAIIHSHLREKLFLFLCSHRSVIQDTNIEVYTYYKVLPETLVHLELQKYENPCDKLITYAHAN